MTLPADDGNMAIRALFRDNPEGVPYVVVDMNTGIPCQVYGPFPDRVEAMDWARQMWTDEEYWRNVWVRQPHDSTMVEHPDATLADLNEIDKTLKGMN